MMNALVKSRILTLKNSALNLGYDWPTNMRDLDAVDDRELVDFLVHLTTFIAQEEIKNDRLSALYDQH